MKRIVQLCLMIGGISLFTCRPPIPPDSRPNVLMIVLDDLNDWIGCMGGHPQAHTPNLDRLARMGTLFTNAHASATMCCPSRTSVFSGLRPTTTGVYKNTDTPLEVYRNRTLLHAHFREQGYYVAGAGKLLHRFYYEADQWDAFEAKHKGRDLIGHREDPTEETRTVISGNLTWGGYEAEDSMTFDRATVDWVIDRLQEKRDQPFFLGCGIFRPHIPWFNPQRYVDLYPLETLELPAYLEEDLSDVPPSGTFVAGSITNFTLDTDLHHSQNADHQEILKKQVWKEAVQAYLASVSYADAQVGRLLDALETSEAAKNTIVVLWSDHGWHLGEKQHWRKGTLWEEVTRVPFMLAGPGLPGNQRCGVPVSLLDLYPTLNELCGVAAEEELEGKSLVPQLNGPTQPHDPILTSLGPESHSLRSETWRYISYGDGQEELYDHQADPEEWHNLAGNPAYEQELETFRERLPQSAAAPVKGPYNRKNEK
ncbi:MAG: sulfatase [Bacteroidota bacterium]